MNRSFVKRAVAVLSVFAAALAASVVSAPTSSADTIELPDLLAEVDSLLGFEDALLSCTEFLPHAISLQQVPTTLDVQVLLDGVNLATAQEAVSDMEVAYGPLGITVVPSYQNVSFATVDAMELNQAAKDLFGGERPAGTDVVYTMTTKNITSATNGKSVAGLADCIGGIRYPDRAFAVGEVIPDGPGTLLGIPLPFLSGSDQTGKTMAHEIGHLLGGHHHYFSVEGLLAADPNLGTLMGPAISIISLRFSTLNSLMVKGHMEIYG